MAAAAFAGVAGPAQAACTSTTATTWTGGAGAKSWTDAGNWTPGVPGTCSDVTIDPGGADPLDLANVPTGTFHIHSLVVGPGVRLHGGDLFVDTTLTWTTDPAKPSNGVGYGLTVAGHATFQGGGQTFFEPSSTMLLAGGSTFTGGTNQLDIRSNGMLALKGATTVVGPGLDVEGGGTGAFPVEGTLALTNDAVRGPGRLAVHRGAFGDSAGTTTLDLGSEIDLEDVTTGASPTTLSGPGVMHVHGTGGSFQPPDPTFYPGGAFTLASGAALRVDSGTVQGGGGRLDGTGTFDLRGGTLAGALTLGSGVTTALAAGGQKLLAGDAAIANQGTFDTAAQTLARVGGSPTLTNSGTLRGGGTLQAAVTNAGTVSPDGTLAVDGGYTQQSGGRLDVEVTASGADRLAVSGAATIAGTLAVRTAAGVTPAGPYDVLTSSGVSGTFGSAEGVAPAYALSYTATAARLTATGQGSGGGQEEQQTGTQTGTGSATGDRGPEPTTPPPTDTGGAGRFPTKQVPTPALTIPGLCVDEETITVKASVVRGCFAPDGNRLTAPRLEVDGLILTAGSGDKLVVDRQSGEITTKNGADVEASTRLPDGVRAFLGKLKETGARVYDCAATKKAEIVAGIRDATKGAILFAAESMEVLRDTAHAAGDVILRGVAKLGDAASNAVVNVELRVSGALRSLVGAAGESKLRAVAAVIRGFRMQGLDLHLEGGTLVGTAKLDLGALGLIGAANTEIRISATQIEGGVHVRGLKAGTVTLDTLDLAFRDLGHELVLTGTIDSTILHPQGSVFVALAGAAQITASATGGLLLEVAAASGTVEELARLTNGHLTWHLAAPGGATFGGTVTVGPDPRRQFVGTLDGWSDGVAALRGGQAQMVGTGTLTMPGVSAKADGIISTLGTAACAGLRVRLPGVDATVRVGVSRKHGLGWNVVVAGCDIGPFRVAPPAARAAQAGPPAVTLPGGADAAVLAIHGDGGAPDVTLAGPGGRVVTPAPGALTLDRSTALAIPSPDEQVTYVVVGRPERGSWTIQPRAGSAPVTRVEAAQALPRPAIRARVSGRGATRTLTYDVARAPGQNVRFVESGRELHATLGSARAAHGRLRFRPADGAAGARTILAVVEQDGAPRTTLNVARYRAPQPRAPRVGRVSVRRTARGAKITWSRARGADGYVVTFRLGRAAPATATTSKPSFTLPALDPADGVRVVVRALDAAGRRGPPRAATLKPRR
ncbi:MAG TPA: hypothetical protein VF549_16035 [Solirubrobacteraceae bacterium]